MFSRSRPLDVGDTAPGFALETSQGVETTLASSLMAGPVLIEFLRGTWDPDSRARLRALADAHERLTAHSCKLLCLLCERPGTVAHYLEQNSVPFPVLVDQGRTVTKAYGVWHRFTLPVWNIARPSTFLLDPCGYVVYSYVAQLSIHAADVEEVLAQLAKMKPKR